jgi:PIN domain nuclease of toxin-antitoxin system
MTYLLDTHVFIWLDTVPGRLSATANDILTDPSAQLLMSTASIWEMAIKIQQGKLSLSDTLEAVIAEQTSRNPIGLLPILTAHSVGVGRLPTIHKDPFDRMLVSQALAEGATLLTDDAKIRRYPVRTTW